MLSLVYTKAFFDNIYLNISGVLLLNSRVIKAAL